MLSRSGIPPKPSAQQLDLLMPLVFFYGQLELELPLVEFIRGEDMPEPQRHLLVHQSDMTPRLREHHGNPPDLTVVSVEGTEEYVLREVVLGCGGRPVEYGAIGIHLDGFPPHVKRIIRAGIEPLGAILETEGIAHGSAPNGYFMMEADARMARLLGAVQGTPLFGRCNVLSHQDGTAFADIVEVLPPA